MKLDLPGVWATRPIRRAWLLCGACLAMSLPVHEYARDGWGPQTAAAANFVQLEDDNAKKDAEDQGPEEGKEERSFNPQTVIDHHFAPIVKAPFVAADQAGEIVRDHELVLGVEVNGEARAYPINLLCGPRREIINDVLGGQAIAATW